MSLSPYIRKLREKVGADPLIIPGITAIVLDDVGRVLLQRSSDDGLWHTVGGAIEPNEHPAHAAVREVKEEAGIEVRPELVTGVYTHPPAIYSNGDQCLYIGIAFRCRWTGGELRIADDESLELRFFATHELPPLSDIDRLTVEHAVNSDGKAFFEI